MMEQILKESRDHQIFILTASPKAANTLVKTMSLSGTIDTGLMNINFVSVEGYF